ncbi:hypothetical protein, partial [Peptostreptococcus anaerobius]|uniref:hypothetical protein n=1 Tax=Peptostreptococcus anaerobius TaxID=1261 RepID=UPI0025503BC6
TQKLSSLALKVLGGKPPGRLGRSHVRETLVYLESFCRMYDELKSVQNVIFSLEEFLKVDIFYS